MGAVELGADEAGYGPLLGPLTVAVAAVEADDAAALAGLWRLGVADSKAVHRPGDLAPLERVALPALGWLAGFAPDRAADAFALAGEGEDGRTAPWMAGAGELGLPVAARELPQWSVPGCRPLGLAARILHPRHLNAARRAGMNRAACLLDALAGLLARSWPDPARPARIALDRLGGRTDYAPLVQRAWPGAAAALLDPDPRCRRYRVGAVELAVRVGAERHAPLVALASCIAKYLRELHLLLLNRWWCARHRWLAPTAGYGSDARRWLYQIGEGQVAAWRDELVREGPGAPA